MKGAVQGMLAEELGRPPRLQDRAVTAMTTWMHQHIVRLAIAANIDRNIESTNLASHSSTDALRIYKITLQICLDNEQH